MKAVRIVSAFLLLIALGPLALQGQIIGNGDFEENDGCPGSLGQIGMLDDWFIVVESADYYACGFTSGAFPTDGVAATGDAYAGFASYGDFNGSAEAIGQQLPAPLDVGVQYTFTAALKMPTSGAYSSVCGGLCAYGFMGMPPTGIIADHTAFLAGSNELGCTAEVSNTDWETYSFTFTADQAYDYLVITTSVNESCAQNIFVDSIVIESSQNTETVTVCAGDEVTLDPELGASVDWFEVVGGVNEFIQNSGTYAFTPAADMQILADDGLEPILYNLVVTPLPVVDLGPDVSMCPGDETQFDAGPGWDEIQWEGEVADQVFIPIIDGEYVAGTYEVQVTLDGCSGTDEIELILFDEPDFESLLVTNPGCEGQCNGQLEITLDPDWTYEINGAVSADLVIDLCAADYALFLTNGTCENSMTVNMTADPLPVINLPINYVICDGSEVTMTATSVETDLTYNWESGTVGEAETATPNENDTFCVTATDDNGCTSLASCTEIFFYPELELTGPADVIPCPGDIVALQANATGGDGEYVWSWENEANEEIGTDDNLNFEALVPTTLSVTVVDGCNPEGLTAEVQIQTVVLPAPELTVDAPTVCIPVPAGFSLSNTEEFSAINWDFGDGNVGTGATVSHVYEVVDCFDITVAMIHDEGCPLNLSFEEVLCAYENPVADYSIREGTIVSNNVGTIHFDNTSEGAVEFVWTIDGSSVSTEESPELEGWELPGIYEVCLEAINAQGCADLLCTEIDVQLEPQVFVPNAFTPDLDGINEVFKPVLSFEPTEFTFEIFDRWGELIFVSNDPEIGWIGNNKNGGHYVQADIYTYQITIVMPDTGNARLFEGHVTVLR